MDSRVFRTWDGSAHKEWKLRQPLFSDIWAIDDEQFVVEAAFKVLLNEWTNTSEDFPKPSRLFCFDSVNEVIESMQQVEPKSMPQLCIVDMHFPEGDVGKKVIEAIKNVTVSTVLIGYSAEKDYGDKLPGSPKSAKEIAKTIGADNWFFRTDLDPNNSQKLLDCITVAQKVRLTSLQSTVNLSVFPDIPNGNDALMIDSDVDAMASLITSKNTGLPLAVGVFGDWGMGKSFFVNKVIRQVKHLAATKNRAFAANIIQIEFNAWHYIETDIWASLVTHIFDSLLKQDSDENDSELLEKRKKILTDLAGATSLKKSAERDLNEARQKFEAANRRFDANKRKQNRYTAFHVLKGALSSGKWDTLENELISKLQDIDQKNLQEVKATLGEFKKEERTWNTLTGRLKRVLSYIKSPSWLEWLFLILVVFVLLTLFLEFVPNFPPTGYESLTGFITVSSLFFYFARKVFSKARSARKILDEIVFNLETAVENFERQEDQGLLEPVENSYNLAQEFLRKAEQNYSKALERKEKLEKETSLSFFS